MDLFDIVIGNALIMVPGTVIALARFSAITVSCRPFIYFYLAGFANELLSVYLLWQKAPSNMNGNIYVFIEFVLILWLFRNWGRQIHPNRLYLFLAGSGTILWLADNLIVNSIYSFNSLFRLYLAIVLICLSTEVINHAVVTRTKNILRDARVIVSTGLLVFFIYKVFFEILYLINLPLPKSFHQALYLIFLAVNVVCNLLYTIALLWMPTKQKFYLPFAAAR